MLSKWVRKTIQSIIILAAIVPLLLMVGFSLFMEWVFKGDDDDKRGYGL